MSELGLRDLGTEDALVAFLRENGRLDQPGSTALYKRLQDAFRSAIRQDLLRPGEAIPGERELAQKLALSRVTVRRALKDLVEDSLLVQRHGARTSVAERVEKSLSGLSSFTEDMLARGLEPGVRWLSREQGPALSEECLALGLSPGTAVCRFRRLRTAGGIPMALENTVVPGAFLPEPDLVSESLYETLAQQGHLPVRALQRMRSDVASEEEAALLEVPVGSPILDIERRCFGEGGETVEFARSRYRGDSYDFLVELHR
ncbi:transcriptional regulator, GntR family [Faunimonas pinastri]|uniref:Transcriptional regulator, GntR family n=1 Tax=Faunimonas pinastri TaxID=1855383 RepID=A0A1H9F981_9HYPH|nr:GntR family transcriptional regulator [Faunimonas pinastri]SEQ34439.1 transcriptional regulator, GntR family [Faunimonas pinastri]